MIRRAVLLLFLLPSACGKPKETLPSRPSDRVTIVFRHGRVSGFEAFFHQVIEGFEREHPSIHVAEEVMPWDSGQQHQLYAINLEGKSDAIDVMGLDIIWIAEFARAGWLMDLSPWFSADKQAKFLPATIRAATFQGGIYGVPWFTDAGLLYYRKDLLAKYGLGVPQTWPELIHAAQTVLRGENNPNLSGFLWQGKQYEGLMCDAMEFFGSNGVQVVGENGSWVMDRGRAEEALQLMVDLVYLHKVSPKLVLAADEEVARHVFSEGNALFLRNWPYVLGIFNKSDASIRQKVGLAPLPRFPGQPSVSTLGGWYLGVNRHSKHPQEAFLFAEYFTSFAVQKLLYERLSYLPTRSALYRDQDLLSRHPHLSLFEKILSNARPRPVSPFYMSLSEIFQTEISAALVRIKTPKQAIVDIEIQAKPILGRWR